MGIYKTIIGMIAFIKALLPLNYFTSAKPISDFVRSQNENIAAMKAHL
jgi:hypothetical protein